MTAKGGNEVGTAEGTKEDMTTLSSSWFGVKRLQPSDSR